MNRRIAWIVALVVAALAAAGLMRLRFDTNVLGLLPEELPVVQGLKWHQEHFASAHELIVTVSAPDAATAEDAARRIAEQLKLNEHDGLVRRVLWRPPWFDDPASAGEFLAWSRLQQDPAVTRALLERLQPDRVKASLEAAREAMAVSFSPGEIARLGYDPLGLTELAGSGGLAFDSADRLFASADGTYRVLFVEPAAPPANYKAQADWLAQVRSRIFSLRYDGDLATNVVVAYTGGPVFASEVAHGMEHDMTRSAGGTLVVIAVLFWWAHRRWRPLVVLVGCLALATNLSFAVGGLLLGEMNIISLGFAAILLGLVVDYGLVAYQERLADPGVSLAEVRRQVWPGIAWSALTTAGAFLLLNLGGLPGLGQLGTLVALGVVLGVFVMLYGFLPWAGNPGKTVRLEAEQHPSPAPPRRGRRWLSSFGWWVTVCAGAAVALLLLRGLPAHDPSPESLRPKHSPAFDALRTMQARLEQKDDPLILVTRGAFAGEVAARLRSAERTLASAVERGEIDGFTLATAWWENPEAQPTNRVLLAELAARWPALRSAVLEAGFATNALALAEGMMPWWSRDDAFRAWPTGAVSAWVFGQAAARDADGWFALGLITPGTNGVPDLPPMEGSIVTGWPLLGRAVLAHVEGRLPVLLVGIGGVLAACLWGAFRQWREALLGVVALAASLALLLAAMRVAGWTWNLLNLMALPLLFGTGVDYVLHVQFALRRHAGDLGALWRTTGRALLLCGTTTVVGFGSLAWAGNAGLASLGQVCATGVLCAMAVSLVALPVWWRFGRGGANGEPTPDLSPSDGERVAESRVRGGPPSLYSARLWRVALAVVRRIPAPLCLSVVRAGLMAYRGLQPARVRVVAENLRPVVGDRAEAVARRVFDEFARKLCDLWRYEAGQSIEPLLKPLTGWEHLKAALDAKRGVLLVTVHLGNWEFGAPLLAARGIKLLVLTQPEPGSGFTELRREARARWGIETFVVGDDPFAFVEIIRRLQNGECVALLIDRPPAASAVEVELFGRPFHASVAAAELARATGCAVVPVVLPRVGNVYGAEVLPVVQYDRAALGNRAARTALTGEILRAFEPSLRQYPEQWFHFVPVWNVSSTTDGHR